jgi:hypothetical protein
MLACQGRAGAVTDTVRRTKLLLGSKSHPKNSVRFAYRSLPYVSCGSKCEMARRPQDAVEVREPDFRLPSWFVGEVP